jgi:ankyrin repeat protein
VVRLLLEAKSSIDARDAKGRSSAVLAAMNGHLEVVDVLYGQGADMESRDRTGMNVLIWAAFNGHDQLCNRILGFYKLRDMMDVGDARGITPVMRAAVVENLDVLNVLLRYKPDLHKVDSNGRTALLWSAYDNRLANMQMLLEAGASINAKDSRGNTAMGIAGRFDYKEMEVFLRYYKDVKSRNPLRQLFSTRKPLTTSSSLADERKEKADASVLPLPQPDVSAQINAK